jgi:DNA repair protein RadD
MITLREYQKECLSKIRWSREKGLEGAELVVLPTGSGKSLIVSNLANELNEDVLILQPSKEILEQNLDKLLQHIDRSDIGIYSASMGEKEVKKFTLATIGSIYRHPQFFAHFGFILLDEAHLLNPKSLDGMFSSFLRRVDEIRFANNLSPVKILGLTATPYRMDTFYASTGGRWMKAVATIKLINRTKGNFWKRILFNISTQDLIDQGFLCHLDYIDKSVVQQQDIPLNKSESDFDLVAYEKMLSKKKDDIVKAIAMAQDTSKSVLVFCSSVLQATQLSQMTLDSEVVSAKTPKKERERIIENFKSGKTKTVFNVSCMTTGFDHPSLDAIILLRPTRSLGLYSQMIGRGLRIAPGKTSCKVIDLTSTVKNMGRVETIKLVKREKWELESETKANWHNEKLYEFEWERKPKKKVEIDFEGF